MALSERARAALDTVTSTPWRRAPVLLWRRPGVLLPTAGAAAVLAASLSAVPLFLSSAGTEAVELQADERCPRDTGATWLVPRADLDTPDPFTPLADELGPSTPWGRIETTLTGSTGTEPAVVLYREGALDRLPVVEGEAGTDGLWLSDRGVDLTGAEDTVDLGGVELPVAGVYHDMSAGTIADRYWCAHRGDLLLIAQSGDLIPPPPLVFADRATWERLQEEADAEVVQAGWEAPLRGEVTVTEARDLVDELGCGGEAAGELPWCEGDQQLIDRRGAPTWTPRSDRVEAPDTATFVERAFDTSLPFVGERARSIQIAVGGGVWPVAVLAAFAGTGLVAATALLWCDRRRREVALLGVRGVGPAAIAFKAVLELAVPLVVGTAAGVLFAWALVVGVGPSPALEPAAVGQAAWVGGLALVLSALVLALVVGVRARAPRIGRRRTWLQAVPWELPLALLTLWSWHRLGSWGVPVSNGARVSHIDVVGLMFPVLFLITAVAVAARVLVLALRPLRAVSRNWPNPLYLAVRRVARYRSAVIGIVAASALATGVFGYAATIQRSMDATLEAKTLVYLGADVVVRMPVEFDVPDELADRSTSVLLFQHSWVQGERRHQVNTFAIDHETFEQASYWDDSLASESLEELVDRLAAPPVDGRIPVLLVGVNLPDEAEAAIETQGTTRFDIEQVARVDQFPGMRRGSPVMYVDAAVADDLGLRTLIREVRIRGDREEILATLNEAGTRYEEITTADAVADAAAFLTVSQTFGFMRSLAVASGLLVIAGVAVYLDARRRGRVLAYAFARRMGLTARGHRRALFVELLASIAVGCWLGLVVALVGAGLAHERLDPLPTVRPDPLLRPATLLLVGLALAALVLAAVAAFLAQRATDRDDPLEVLRAGT